MEEYKIDKIKQAMDIGYIGHGHASFANYILGALQESIRNSIRNGVNDIPSVEIAQAINHAHKYAEEYFKLAEAAK